MARRGGYQRPFLHFSVGVLVLAAIISAPILANAYPGGSARALADFTPPSAVVTSLDLTEYGVQTQISEKPRDQIISYKVQSGDTLSTIAQKFGVSVDSVKWANDLKRDSLTVGQDVKIPPVTGIVHKVREGETVYSIAKKYRTESQQIVNFPFNDFTDLDTFGLTPGQTLFVPDGIIEAEQPKYVAQQMFAQVVSGVRGSSSFIWPTTGIVTQYPIWYHMAVDIANSAAPAVIAADTGTVIYAACIQYGYGCHVIIDHGNGYKSLYGHLQRIDVSSGQAVSKGTQLGQMGSTGRSTGTHLHFEIRSGETLLNPLNFLK